MKNQFEALQKLDLMKAEEVVRKERWGTRKATAYNFTKKAEPYIWESTLVGDKVYSLCFGDRVVKDITKVSPWPQKPDKGAHVKYTYTINNIPDWANDKELQEVSPVLKRELEGIGKTEMKNNLAQTDKGFKQPFGSAFPMTRVHK